MSYHPVEAVRVLLWGREVGAVALDPASGAYVFEYTPAWAAGGLEFAPLTMPTSTRLHVFPTLPRGTFLGLPAAIADALPDAFGNALVEQWLATKGVDRSAITPLDRLAYQGRRGMGALEFKPVRGPHAEKATAVELGQLVAAARAAAQGRLTDDVVSLRPLIRVGTSAGGARAKAVVAWNPADGDLLSGQVEAPPGYQHWLIKFDGVGRDTELGTGGNYGRIEQAYATMARQAGIDMPPTRLLEEGGRAHFMVRRFDRAEDGAKLHLQSLCGLMGLDFNAIGVHAYEQLLQAVDLLGLGAAARAEVFRRAAFNVAAANCDDHTKNHAFLMMPDGAWSLAPAYDLTHAFNPAGRWTFQHLMSVNGKFGGIGRADLLAMADRFAVPGAAQVLYQVADAVGDWPRHAAAAGLDSATAAQVAADFTTVTGDGYRGTGDGYRGTGDGYRGTGDGSV
ncbi:MAG: type II toxin-antitoxin system HipA family toxin [Bifidobacteriaceae bacterium]|jgi:serine/threonine-protein kinase HipA|nr:type II toxin-antitoxin system HipA family toxin [Bifidobacteriaceae bacterium]